MQKNYGILMAKTGKEAQEEWLPLWMHLRDTAGIMKCLVQKWTPKAVFCAANLEYEPFLKAAILEAWQDIFDQALKLAGLRTVGELPVLTMEAQILLSGLLIMADWIGVPRMCGGDPATFKKKEVREEYFSHVWR